MTAIRPEAPADIAAIDILLRNCFGGSDEAKLVAALRDDGDLTLSLVAENGREIIGHIAFSPLLIETHPDADFHALAPFAVAEKHRRQGLGARLTETGLDHFREIGADGAIVLGDPAYYGRYGFRADLASGLACIWSGPNLQAILFQNSAIGPAGKLIYADAFSSLT